MYKYLENYDLKILIAFLLNIIAIEFFYFSLAILEAVLVSLFTSFVFYFIVVYVPAYLHKEKTKRVFLRFYDQFKQGVLWEVLELMEFTGNKNEKINELKDIDKFIEFTGQPSSKKGQTNWHVLMNNIDIEKYQYSLKRVIVKLSELQREIDFLVRTLDIENEELLHRLRHLDRALQDGRFKEELDLNLSEDKEFTDALYELLSGKSLVDGKHGDFIKKWIEKI